MVRQSLLEALCAVIGRLGPDALAGVKTVILQDLTYHEHLADPLAELAALIVTRHPTIPLIGDLLVYNLNDLCKSLDIYYT